MRPNKAPGENELYECFGCGNRTEAPEGRFCPSCGSELRNLSRGRDL